LLTDIDNQIVEEVEVEEKATSLRKAILEEAGKSALLEEQEKVKIKNDEAISREMFEEAKKRDHGSISDKETSNETFNSSAELAEKETEAAKSALLEEQEKVKTKSEEATSKKLVEEGKKRYHGSSTDKEASIETSNSAAKVAEREIDDIEGKKEDVDASSSSESKKFEEEKYQTPTDMLEELKFGDEVDGLNDDDELLTDIDNQIVEEVEDKATLLRKEEELRVFEEKRRKMKEEALKAMWEEAAKSALLEEQEKFKIRNDEAIFRELLEEGTKRDHGSISDIEALNETFNSSAEVAEKDIEATKSALLEEQEKVRTKNEEATSKKLVEEGMKRYHGSSTGKEALIETSNSAAKVAEREFDDIEGKKVNVDASSSSESKKFEEEKDLTPTDVLEELKFGDEVDGLIDDELLTDIDNQIVEEVEVEEIWEEAAKYALVKGQENVKVENEETISKEGLEEGKSSITDKESSIKTFNSAAKVTEEEIDDIEEERVEDVDAFPSESKKFKEDTI